jgi:hypothetical protein
MGNVGTIYHNAAKQRIAAPPIGREALAARTEPPIPGDNWLSSGIKNGKNGPVMSRWRYLVRPTAKAMEGWSW